MPTRDNTAPHMSEDVLPWDEQPGETPEQYAAFCQYRDSVDRDISSIDGLQPSQASKLSKKWFWSYRAWQWDLYVTKRDQEKLVRYRMQMDDRHRKIASTAQSKVVKWLQSMRPEVMTATEAVRMLEVSVKLERLAAHADDQAAAVDAGEMMDGGDVEGAETIADLLSDSGLNENDLAEALHKALPES